MNAVDSDFAPFLAGAMSACGLRAVAPAQTVEQRLERRDEIEFNEPEDDEDDGEPDAPRDGGV